MSIKKQEFYEGAALHLLTRSGKIAGLRYQAPFFVLNDSILALLKYSTKSRSPWGFTFTPLEQDLLSQKADAHLYVGLICGSDGVVAIKYASFLSIVSFPGPAARVACFRDHGEHYQVSGPAGTLKNKVSRAQWQKILDDQGDV